MKRDEDEKRKVVAERRAHVEERGTYGGGARRRLRQATRVLLLTPDKMHIAVIAKLHHIARLNDNEKKSPSPATIAMPASTAKSRTPSSAPSSMNRSLVLPGWLPFLTSHLGVQVGRASSLSR